MYFFPNYVFSLFSFVGFLLCMIPLPWHLEAWNTGTCLYMIWAGLGCLNLFINSIIWNGNAFLKAVVWCDISSHFMIGLAVALPACSLCINRRLYHIATVKSVTVTKREKRRAIMVDLAIGIGIPVLQMALQYIVQGHRFNIYEDIGCYPWTYDTPEAFPVTYVWPLVIGTISLVYCILSIRAFVRRTAQFNELLSAHNNLAYGRYLRLMCLAGIEILGTIPLGSWFLSLDVQQGIHPWISWANVKWGFHRVDQIPAVIWKANHLVSLALEMNRWLVVCCAFIFFGFFGFADEARKHYRLAFSSIAKRVGYSTASFGSGLNSSDDGHGHSRRQASHMVSIGGGITSLPFYTSGEKRSKRSSFDSFDDKLDIADVGGALSDLKMKSLTPPPSSSSGLSSAASSLPPSADDRYSLFVPEIPHLAMPEPVVERDVVSPHSESPSPSSDPSKMV